MALPRLFPALAGAMVALAGCATAPPAPLSPAEQTRIEIARSYGGVDQASMPGFFADKGTAGRGFAMMRKFSRSETARLFSAAAPESPLGTKVLDVGIEVKMIDGFPLYRMALRPRNIEPHQATLWPSHVALTRMGPGGLEQTLAARLPRDRRLDDEGMIWTDWTYCSDCFALRALEGASMLDAGASLALIDEAEAAALALNGGVSAYSDSTLEFGPEGLGIVLGAEAFQMARRAGPMVDRARGRVAAALPNAGAYRALVERFKASTTPAQAIYNTCGEYQPSSSSASTEQVAAESERFQRWETCADGVVDTFDRRARELEIADFAREEARLARVAGLSPAQRHAPAGLAAEMEQARRIGQQANARFQAHLRSLEEAGRRNGTMKLEGAAGGNVLVAPGAFELGGDVLEGLSEEQRRALEDEAGVEPEDGPPLEDEIFVTRLMQNGANLELGAGGDACAFGMECEIGKVEALIAVRAYCSAEGGTTRTVPGWGLVVQRYLPKSRAEEIKLMEQVPGTHAVATADQASLDGAIAAMEAERLAGGTDRAFYRSYMDFYPVNNDEKGCKDDWRDAARHKVLHNL